MKSYKKGFTLIELLVVIFIIGILSAFIIINVQAARMRSLDRAVQSNVDSVRARAEILYDKDGADNYSAICTDDQIKKSLQQALNSAKSSDAPSSHCITGTDNSGVAYYVAWVPLATAGFWCVDNRRTSSAYTSTTAVPTSASTQCPTTGQTTLGNTGGSNGNNGNTGGLGGTRGNWDQQIGDENIREIEEGSINEIEFRNVDSNLQQQEFESF